jgi:hopanoid C-3 methylase
MDVPEVVNISINTPYPGTETWLTEQRRLQTRDYRLFDIQHAVLPTKLPLDVFYRELLDTQWVLYRKHMNWRTTPTLARVLSHNIRRGQINFIRGIMNYKRVYNVEKMLADHARPVRYELPTRAEPNAPIARPALYIHAPSRRAARTIDGSTERFVNETRVGTSH